MDAMNMAKRNTHNDEHEEPPPGYDNNDESIPDKQNDNGSVNEVAKEAERLKLKQELQESMQEQFRMLRGPSPYGPMSIRDLCLAPSVVIPKDFKMPELIKFDGSTNPIMHLRMYCTKMGMWSKEENFLISFFSESLEGAAWEWYMQLDQSHIRCWDNVSSRVPLRSWINAITGPHLQELYLCLRNPQASHDLPCGVCTCTSLVSLILRHDIFVLGLPPFCLPSLKTLELDIMFVNLDKFLSGCPALETLDIYLLWGWSCDDTQAIHMPHSLKSFTFRDDGFGETIEHLEIDSPSLEYLHIDLVARYLGILVSSFPNMVEARLCIHYDDVNVAWVPEFLKALSRTRLLVLTASTTECLLRAPSLDLPEFCCLLSLQIDFLSFNSRFLVDLLHNCPRLQVLIMLIYGHQKSPEPSSWTQSIPNCVISHLSNIEFRGYRDYTEEREFTAYILQRGLVLKTVTIHTDIHFGFDQKKKDHILKELSIVPRGSSICQLTLD